VLPLPHPADLAPININIDRNNQQLVSQRKKIIQTTNEEEAGRRRLGKGKGKQKGKKDSCVFMWCAEVKLSASSFSSSGFLPPLPTLS
jgi:hypothetical protein